MLTGHLVTPVVLLVTGGYSRQLVSVSRGGQQTNSYMHIHSYIAVSIASMLLFEHSHDYSPSIRRSHVAEAYTNGQGLRRDDAQAVDQLLATKEANLKP